MKEIWLLRHAKAEPGYTVADFERTLEESGKDDAFTIATYLKNADLHPDVILSSPATRAIETAKIVHRLVNHPTLRIKEDLEIYNATAEQLKSILMNCEESIKRLLLVGHNPGLEELLIYLVGYDSLPKTDEWLGTATFVRLRTDSLWSELQKECTQLITILSPRSLKYMDSNQQI
jgi:phosphohistidine phosphatase